MPAPPPTPDGPPDDPSDSQRGSDGDDGPASRDDPEVFVDALAAAFDATDAEVRVVARQARDLADSGRYRADAGRDPTPALVVDELGDAPDERLPSKWNWWIGSLELAYGGYRAFRVRAVERE